MKVPRSLPLLAVLATLAVHLVVAAVFEVPGSFRKYTVAAEQHLAGELPTDRLMDLSPLYFEITVAASRLVPRPDGILAVLQVLLAAAAAGFLAELLERRFGRPLAAAGVVVFLLDRHLVVYERILEPEACLVFFVLGWIVFLERTVHEPERDWRPPLVAGLLAGASLLTRPTFLPLCFLVPLYLWSRNRRHWWRPALVFSLPVATAFLLLALRATAVTGDPWTPVMNPGTVFYEGNQALSHGTSAVYPPIVQALMRVDETRPDAAHEHYRTVARAAVGQDLSISEVNAYWSATALKYILLEPRRFVGLLGDKLIRVFHSYRWHDVVSAWRYDQALPIPFLPFAALSALAILGMLFEARRFSAASLFYALAGSQMAVMLVFYVSARQRLVLLPALIYFALVALEWILRKRRRALPMIALFFLLAICFLLPNDLMRDDHYVKRRNSDAQVLLARLREAASREPLAAHTELALEALSTAPWVEWTPAYFPQEERSLDEILADRLAGAATRSAAAAFDFGVVLLRAGRLDEAAAIFEGLVRDDRGVYRNARQASSPRYYLARVEALRGNRERAVELLREALERSPGDPFVLADLLALNAERVYPKRLDIGLSLMDVQYLKGRAFLFHGRVQDAAAALRVVVERLPDFRTARIYLAAALGASGRVDEGAAQYLEAVKNQPDPLLLSARVRDLFRSWAARHPGDPQVQLFAAHVLHEHGYFREALEILGGIEPPETLKEAFAEETRRLRDALAFTSPS